MTLRFDLHCHSNNSDGVLTSAELALRAKNNGVDVWALTDHDEVKGIPAARAAAQKLGLDYVTGVEISITWSNKTIHIVGLHFDETNPALVKGLAQIRQSRQERAHMIDARRDSLGIHHAYDGALTYVASPEMFFSTLFACYYLNPGYGPDLNDFFSRYLSVVRPSNVAHQ